jgi:hypothetical protein
MKHFMTAVLIAFSALQAAADEPCEKTDTTADMRLVFVPSALTGTAKVWLFDEKGAFLREYVIPYKGPLSEYPLVAPSSFFPKKRFISTTGSNRCVQGKGLITTPFAPCTSWFYVDLKSQGSPPVTIAVNTDAPSTPVSVALERTRAGGYCTRTFERSHEPVEVFDQEEVSVAVGRLDGSMGPFGCGVNIKKSKKNDSRYVTLTKKTDVNRAAGRNTGQGSGPSSGPQDYLAAQCELLTVRILE